MKVSDPSKSLSSFDTGIECLSLVAKFLGTPCDPLQLKREFDADNVNLAEINLVRAIKHLGLKAKANSMCFGKVICGQLAFNCC
jgi:ABC-type bacteriocin/lantibiotic exporter with double-glycine peptidase domain